MAAGLKVAKEKLGIVNDARCQKGWLKSITISPKNPESNEPLYLASEFILKASIERNGWDENNLFFQNLESLVEQVIPRKWWNQNERYLKTTLEKKQKITLEYLLQDIKQGEFLAIGISAATWRRFLTGEQIQTTAFQAFCKILDLQSKEIAHTNKILDPYIDTKEKTNERNNQHYPKLNTYGFIPPEPLYFVDRKYKRNEIMNAIELSRIVHIWGQPGIGKTCITAQIAKILNRDYKVFWLDKIELITLDQLVMQIKYFLMEQGELGISNFYDDDNEVKLNNKIAALIEIVRESQNNKYAFFIDTCSNLDEQPLKEIQYFIERFLTHGGDSRVIIIDYSPPERSLKPSIAVRVQQILIEGLELNEAHEYLNRQNFMHKIVWNSDEISATIEKTGGHPIALDLIILRRQQGAPLNKILDNLVEDDRQYGGGELHQKLLEEVSRYLDTKQKDALHKLAIFRIPIPQNICNYLNISQDVANLLIQLHFLTSIDSDNKWFKIHPLIRQFWKSEYSSEELIQLHQSAAEFYINETMKDYLDEFIRLSYLEAHHHLLEAGLNDRLIHLNNDLINRVHLQERLPAERLIHLDNWLSQLDDSTLENNPWLLIENGRRLDKIGSIVEAESTFQKAEKEFREQDNKLGESISLYYIGKMLHLQKQPQVALNVFKSVLKLAHSYADEPMKIRTLGKIIDCYISLGEYTAAEDAANKAVEIALTSKNKLEYALVMYDKGSIKRRQGNFSEAETLFKDCVNIFQELKDIYHHSKALSRLSLVQYYQGKFQLAIVNFKDAITLKEKINDQQGCARDFDYLANVYTRLGDYEKADLYNKKSLEIKKGTNSIDPDIYGQIKTYNNLTKLALLTENLSEADKYLQITDKLITNDNEKFHNLKGVYFRLQGDFAFAIKQYKSALQFYENSANCFKSPYPDASNSYAFALLGLGITYLAIREISSSEHYLLAALEIFDRFSMDYDKALALIYIAKLNSLRGKINDGKDYNQKAILISKEINAQNIYLQAIENQGFIEENDFLNSFNMDYISDMSKDQSIKNLINGKASKYYDELIQTLTDSPIERARLQIKKYIWRLVIKILYREPISIDNAYQALLKEPFAGKIIQNELLQSKYTLSNSHFLSKNLCCNLANCALYVLIPLEKLFKFDSNLIEEVEDLATSILHPNEYLEIASILESRFPNRDQFILQIRSEIERSLRLANIESTIHIRAKTISSIYRKQLARKVSLDKILDLVGIRIITKTEDDCYLALSVVQNLGSFFEGNGVLREPLRDFIEKPKANGYRSLHINIEYGNPEPRIVEFQIRTQEMHLAAEVGFSALGFDEAAHQNYKEPTAYAQPSRARIYDLDQQKGQVKLIIICEIGTIKIIGKALQKFEKLDILSVDIDEVKSDSSDNKFGKWIVVEFTISTKTKISKEQIYLSEVLGKLVYYIHNNIVQYYYECSTSYNLNNYLERYYYRIDFPQNQTGILTKLYHSLISSSSRSKYKEKFETYPNEITFEQTIIRIELRINNEQSHDNKFVNDDSIMLQKDLSKFSTLIITSPNQKSIVEKASFSIEEKARLLRDLTSFSSYSDNFVFVFTPKGDLMKLPAKATPIDFAYRIHTDIGNQCTGAFVNGKFVPLHTNLSNGDIVEIVTQKNSQPNWDWLQFIRNQSTRNKIIQGYRRIHREQNIAHGRDLIEKELGKNGFDAKLKSDSMKQVALICQFHNVDDLIAAIGYGGVKLNLVVKKYRDILSKKGIDMLEKIGSKFGFNHMHYSEYIDFVINHFNFHGREEFLIALSNDEVDENQVSRVLQDEAKKYIQLIDHAKIDTFLDNPIFPTHAISNYSATESIIVIGGETGLLFRLAQCCKPSQYCSCIGTVQKLSRGVLIHKMECSHVNLSGKRNLIVEWLSDIRVEVLNKKGVLRDITNCIAAQNIDIWKNRVNTSSKDSFAFIDFRILVRDKSQLLHVFQQLEKLNNVQSVYCLNS